MTEYPDTMSDTLTTKFKRHSIEDYKGDEIKGYLVLDAETGTEYGFVYKHVERHTIRGRVGNISQGVIEDTRWHFQIARGERGYNKVYRQDGDGWDRGNATERLLEKIARAL